MRPAHSIVPAGAGSIFLTFSALVLLVVAPLALTPDAASAQTVPSPYRFIDTRHEVGVFAGIVRPNRGTFGFGPGDGTALGARYTLNLSGPFSVEAVGMAIPGTRDVVDPTAPAGSRAIGEADVFLTSIEARIKFSLTGHRTWNGLSPHVLVGGGGVFDLEGEQQADLALPLDQRFDFNGSFLGSLGTGVRWLPSERLTVRADGIFSLWRLTTPSGYAILESELGPVEQTQWVRAPSLTLGAAYRF